MRVFSVADGSGIWRSLSGSCVFGIFDWVLACSYAATLFCSDGLLSYAESGENAGKL